eukprot:15314111-Alexandrium_andersonii.AAC.1
MSASLVGSEMCIRDRSSPAACQGCRGASGPAGAFGGLPGGGMPKCCGGCLLYTSDAADDM